MKQGKMIGYFIADQQSAFYQSSTFTRVMQFVQSRPNLCKIKEKQTRNGLRLILVFEHIKSIDKAYLALSPFEVKKEKI